MSRAWMPLYIADYLADTQHLKNAASGSYLHLIMHYWQHGGLPSDDKMIRRIARCEQRWWPQIKSEIEPFFHDCWKHKRIDQELEKANDISSKRSAIATAGWNKRNAKAFGEEHAKAYANGMHARVRGRATPQSQSHKDSLNGELRHERGNGQVYVKQDSKAGQAWNEHAKRTKGVSQVWDMTGGWYFPSEYPPPTPNEP
jgi:uncharacterized protein YdaU (DUF1376 family)